jgi:hypothetical protein
MRFSKLRIVENDPVGRLFIHPNIAEVSIEILVFPAGPKYYKVVSQVIYFDIFRC